MVRFIEVTRAKDLLHLQFEFVNLQPEGIATSAPVLKRIAAGAAFIIVRFPPQHVAELVRDPNSQLQLPFKAFLASPSRIAFRVPDTVAQVSLSLEALLLKLTEWDTVPAPDTLDDKPVTVIEFPDRLLIVPERGARLAHNATLLTDDNWTELWHTKLVMPPPSAQHAPGAPRFHAIKNPQDGVNRPLNTTLTKDNRSNIVTQSAGERIQSRRFSLSTLGATAQLRSTWPASPTITLSKWEHEAVAGRDFYVRTTQQGFLFPFGHRASLDTITRREVTGTVAELRAQETLNLLEESRSFTALSMPLRRVVAASATPIANAGARKAYRLAAIATDSAANSVSCEINVLFVTVEEAIKIDFLKALKASDYVNRHDKVNFNGQRLALAEDELRRGEATMAVGEMKLDVDVRDFGTGAPFFMPFMQEAETRMPAVEQLTALGGSGQPAVAANAAAASPWTRIRHTDQYRRLGFNPPNDKKQVFAEFAGAAMDIAVPAAKAGGIAVPTFKGIDGLSKTMGPVANVAQFASGAPADPINPAELLGEAKLLGAILLKDIIAAAAGSATDFLADQPEKLLAKIEEENFFLPRPVMTTVRAGLTGAESLETRFAWKPKVKVGTLGPLEAPPEIRLIVRGWVKASTGANPVTFEVKGQLKTFALSLAGLVSVKFRQVEFTLRSGKKIDVNTDIDDIEFSSKLSFAKAIQKIIPKKGFDGMSIDLRPDGVTVRYALAIPAASMGVLSLENLAFVSSISLPFTDKNPAAIRFSLSERHKPFVVSVAPFGGTGFFGLEIRTDESLMIEAAIEFGGIISFNLLGIVKGGVYLLAGIYLAIESTGGLDITAHLRVGGYVDVLGLVTVSIEFYLALRYADNKLAGIARLTIGIKILFFSETFSFEVKKEIASFGAVPSAAPNHFETVFDREQWVTYCKAFG